jgi:hypothetical protein
MTLTIPPLFWIYVRSLFGLSRGKLVKYSVRSLQAMVYMGFVAVPLY